MKYPTITTKTTTAITITGRPIQEITWSALAANKINLGSDHIKLKTKYNSNNSRHLQSNLSYLLTRW
jgi:hypothetical protein